MATLPTFKEFCSGAERKDLHVLVKQLEKLFSSQEKSFSSPELWSLEYYKRNGYRQINELLRAGDLKHVSDAEITDLEDTIEHLTTALEKSVLPFPITVYRGLRRDYPPATIVTGDYLDEPAFLSTTLSTTTARQISQWESESISSTILEISVPRGTNAIWLDGVLNKGEYELLLTLDTIIQISDIIESETYPQRRYVKCQCVQT